MCSRFGNVSMGKPCLLRVSLADSSYVFTIFKNKKFIPKEITVKRDRTKRERKLLKKAIAELKDKEKNGETNLSMKYIDKIPTVVSSSDLDKSNLLDTPFLDASSVSPKNSTSPPTVV